MVLLKGTVRFSVTPEGYLCPLEEFNSSTYICITMLCKTVLLAVQSGDPQGMWPNNNSVEISFSGSQLCPWYREHVAVSFCRDTHTWIYSVLTFDDHVDTWMHSPSCTSVASLLIYYMIINLMQGYEGNIIKYTQYRISQIWQQCTASRLTYINFVKKLYFPSVLYFDSFVYFFVLIYSATNTGRILIDLILLLLSIFNSSMRKLPSSPTLSLPSPPTLSTPHLPWPTW